MSSRICNAWVSTIDTVFDGIVHGRKDLRATRYSFEMQEGGVLKLTITCENLGIGIMAPGRDQYLLVSWADEGEDLRLVFRGVANSMPANLAENLINLEFLAQPDNFDEKLLAFARTKCFRPYVDELISGSITDITDPAVVLEARSEMFHVDPVTHEITLSDILDFDRLVDLGPHYSRNSMDPSLVMPPVRTASMNFIGEWTQEADGEVDIASVVNFGGGVNGRQTLTDFSSIGESGDLDNSGWSVGEVIAEGSQGLTTRQYYDGRYQTVLHQRMHTSGIVDRSWVRTRYGVMPLALYTYKAVSFPMKFSYRQARREILKVTATADVQDVRAFGFEEAELDDIALNSLTEDATTPVWESGIDYLAGDKVIHRNVAWLCQDAHTSANTFNRILPDWEDYPEALLQPWMMRWVRTTKDVAP